MQTIPLLDTAQGYSDAAAILKRGGLVAFATETVYGLGADATNSKAVASIFEAKGRPSFNPLIVHVGSIEQAKVLVEWNDQAEALADRFWPGPLSLVLKLRNHTKISPLVTAGLDTLAIRVPAHPSAKAILRSFGGPIAAPSANLSGQISPTTAEHVLNGLATKIDAVVDGGACKVGLESTIVGLFDEPRLLRPGGVSADDIEHALGQGLLGFDTSDTLVAPGQMLSHYAPHQNLRMNAIKANGNELLLGFGEMDCDINLSRSGDLVEAAENLFMALHRLNFLDRPIAVAPIPNHGLGLAINDRLTRAAAPRNISISKT